MERGDRDDRAIKKALAEVLGLYLEDMVIRPNWLVGDIVLALRELEYNVRSIEIDKIKKSRKGLHGSVKVEIDGENRDYNFGLMNFGHYNVGLT